MKNSKMITLLLVVAMALTACGPGTPKADPTQTLAAVYTAAAVTMTAQAAMATATPLPLPTDTNTPEPTNTQSATNTPATSILPPSGGQASGDLSAYQADVTIPDGTVMAAGAAFTKTWQLFNKGTTTWTTAYKIVFVSGEAMSGTSTPLSAEIKPGQSTNVSVNMVVPSGSGTKTGYWRLQNAAGTFFGDQVSVQIVIGGTAGPTATTTLTPTAGPSPTPTLTATKIPFESHTVIAGETCDSLALAKSMDVDTFSSLLSLLNPDLGNVCNKLFKNKLTGQTIKIPTP